METAIVMFFLLGTQTTRSYGMQNNSQGLFGPQQVVSESSAIADGPSSAHAADLDGDGDLDILVSSLDDNKILWFENTNGQGLFAFKDDISVSAEGAAFVFAADIDGDRHLDVLSASLRDNKVVWYKNTTGRGDFGSGQIIDLAANQAIEVFASDFDGDGYQDVISASRAGNIAWYKNLLDTQAPPPPISYCFILWGEHGRIGMGCLY